MKIAVVAGSYDPVQLGHVHVIEQACKIAEEVQVVIGPNPAKNYTFTLRERADMLSLSISHTKAYVQILDAPTTVEWCHKQIRERDISHKDICLVRGVRDARDLVYEQAIERNMRAHGPQLNFYYVFGPDKIRNIRSSTVKDVCINKGYEAARHLVPPAVFPYLSRLLKSENKNPMNAFAAKDGVVEDEGQQFVMFGKMKDFFKQAVACGFFQYAPEVDEHQVRCMLDPVPLDLVVSKKFKLMQVETKKLTPTGRQYLPCSQSLGPIIVEANEILCDHPKWTVKGDVVIIEGKHRWIEAMEKGEDKILAWVGDRAISHL